MNQRLESLAVGAAGGVAGGAAVAGVRHLLSLLGKDEAPALKFWVEVDGVLVAGFTECSGLQAEVDVHEYQEGGLNAYVHKLPGRAKYGNVTLRAGVANATDLWEWFYGVSMGQVAGTPHRKNISIVLYNSRGDELVRWNLAEAYPVRWSGPDLKSEGGGAIAVQTVELAHHGFYVS